MCALVTAHNISQLIANVNHEPLTTGDFVSSCVFWVAICENKQKNLDYSYNLIYELQEEENWTVKRFLRRV